MSSTQTTGQVWTDQELDEFWQKVGAFGDELPPREQAAFATIVAAGVEEGIRARGDDVQGYNPIGPFLLGLAAGKMLEKVADENHVWDAIPSPDKLRAMYEQKQKGKPPA